MGRKNKWSPEEKVQIVLSGIKGEKSIAKICRDYEITQTSYYNLEYPHSSIGYKNP